LLTNKEIVSQYFRLLQNKDIDGLKDIFWSDATVYEPFSKLEHGLRGWSQIEPFLKVAIMVNESLSNKIAFEESRRIKNKDLNDEEKNTSDSNNDIVEALVTFQKDNVIKAKFRFELSNQANTVDDSERKKIKALRIQFT
jgi:hypothetical protein